MTESSRWQVPDVFAPLKREIHLFYGWWIVAVAFLCFFAADAFGMYTFGLFIGPMSREMGWTTVMITGALTLRSVTAALTGPIVGPLADTKHGARMLMSIGVLVAGGVAIAVSRAHALWQFYLFYGIFGALAMVGFGGLVTNTIISKWFILKRGRALGISAMGVSISGMVFVPLVHHLISNYGWRNTLVIVGLLIWAFTFIPVVMLVRRRPEDMGLRPDGEAPVPVDAGNGRLEEASTQAYEEEIWTLGEALRTKSLWLLLIATNVTGLSLTGGMIHFVPYLQSNGFSSDIAAGAMTVFALACAVVKVPWGIVAERFNVRYCIIVGYIGCAVALAILLNSTNVSLVFLYAVIYGLALGGNMVLRDLIYANYYGRTFLGTIRGVIMPVGLVSMAGGPLFAAWLKDTTGSYRLAYYIFLLTFIVGAFVMYLAKAPVKPSSKSA